MMKSFLNIAQKFIMALVIYSKDQNVPSICEILSLYPQNPVLIFRIS